MGTIRGKALTVLGPVEPSQLGAVLTHEHLSDTLDERVFVSGAPQLHHADMRHCPLSMENLWWIRQFPYSHPENLRFHGADVEEAVMQEMRFLRASGGGALVDNTCRGMGRNVELMRRVARDTGLHVVAGTEFEKRVLRAAALTQESTGCPAIIHPGRDTKAPSEIARLFAEAGGKMRHTVMSHLDRTFVDDAGALLEFAGQYGCYCEHDLFGIEVSHYQPAPHVSMPSDAQRLAQLKRLVDQGFGDRIVISQDIHTRHRLMKYGGHGYSHILLNVVPAMVRRGFSDEVVRAITQTNPQTWLTFW
ncbi:N-acetyltaurine hydrolase isoform X5 [Amblyomma americanum]